MKNLSKLISSIDGKGYKAYKILEGKTFFNKEISIKVLHVQGDPFATPSVLEISTGNTFPNHFLSQKHRKTALEDFLTRRAYKNAALFSQKSGTGHSGVISVPKPSQEVLERSTLTVYPDKVALRVYVGLPAYGRRISGKNALKLFENAFLLGEKTLLSKNYADSELMSVITLSDEQEFIRKEMKKRKIVAFVANGSILPRKSGISDLPLSENAVPFKSPESLEEKFLLPNGKEIKGMAIKEGITLIAGGGYHGKTTLLEAIQRGIYNHIKGDGREFVLTDETAVKIRTEDGRSIKSVDISNFIRNVPGGWNTVYFSTEDASGSTSMAASLSEAIEAGTKLILIDEDTSATNFMIRDSRMRKLVRKEPIVPLVDRLRGLYDRFGISSILVIGGAGDYLDVCDKVIVMENYVPLERTEEARKIVREIPSAKESETIPKMQNVRKRVIDTGSLIAQGEKHKVKAHGKSSLQIGRETINTAFIEEFTEEGQLKATGLAILKLISGNGKVLFSEILQNAEKTLLEKGINVLFGSFVSPGVSRIRRFEIASVLNRMRRAKFE